jgi:hypothetical protein
MVIDLLSCEEREMSNLLVEFNPGKIAHSTTTQPFEILVAAAVSLEGTRHFSCDFHLKYSQNVLKK